MGAVSYLRATDGGGHLPPPKLSPNSTPRMSIYLSAQAYFCSHFRNILQTAEHAVHRFV